MHYFFHKAALAATLLVSLCLTTCKKEKSYPNDPGGGENPPPNQVLMQGSRFNPASITVSKGTTVMWSNKDNATHTVSSNTNLFESGDMPSGKAFTYTFSSTGTFPYHCKFHSGMTGTVIVN